MYEYLKFAPALTGSVFAVGSHFASLLSLAFLLGQHPVPAPAPMTWIIFETPAGSGTYLLLKPARFLFPLPNCVKSVRQSIE